MTGDDADAATFKERLHLAIDRHPGAPKGHGRGSWLASAISTRVTMKAVQKWLNGEAEPSRPNLAALSRLLSVSEWWLYSGEGVGEDSQLSPCALRLITRIGALDRDGMISADSEAAITGMLEFIRKTAQNNH